MALISQTPLTFILHEGMYESRRTMAGKKQVINSERDFQIKNVLVTKILNQCFQHVIAYMMISNFEILLQFFYPHFI